MTMAWFLPVSILIGAAGSQTAFRSHHLAGAHTKEKTWWLLLVLAWLPTFCWILAQFIDQY